MNKLRQELEKLREFCTRNVMMVGAATGVFSLFPWVFGVMFIPDYSWSVHQLIPSVFIWTIFGMAGAAVQKRYVMLLKERAEAEDTIEWDVQVNGITVGKITDSEYAAIRLRVFSDPRTYGALILQMGKQCLNFIADLFYILPVYAVWIGIALVFFSPGSFQEIWEAYQKSNPTQIYNSVGDYLWFAIITTFLIYILRGGFMATNSFSAGTGKLLRKRFGIPALGEICLIREVDYVEYTNDEFASLLAKQKRSKC